MPKFKLLKESCEKQQLYRCYSCGKTSKETSFTAHQFWTDYGWEYDCSCDNCESTNTCFDGEGSPDCMKCGDSGWYCDDCGLTTCPECWEVWLTPFGEPEDYECWQCSPPFFINI